ncbi:MAG: peroxiredoxin [Xanthobacteraceae bacterium]|nr:peroxiredoxin [Xanthobacteraceae bacterium]MBX3548821.1 peroxiredoxin [Xanthobacteraceae bacterium]
MTASPTEGTPAPGFTLPVDGGGSISLSALKGRKVVVYFYPKADTPGCTKESMDFSRLKPAFELAGATVIGVSADKVAAQDKFKAKHELTVPLASDPDREMIERYGVWVEKSMYGKTFMGIERATFLIDAKGMVRKVWHNVKVEGHAEEVLTAAKAL